MQLELKSVKSQSDTTLARLTQIENRFDNRLSQSDTTLAKLTQIEKRFDNRLNQIENRFAHLEGRQKTNDNVYSYEVYDPISPQYY